MTLLELTMMHLDDLANIATILTAIAGGTYWLYRRIR